MKKTCSLSSFILPSKMSSTADKPQGFRPHEHLRRPGDFRRVYDYRRSLSDARLLVYACPNGLSYLRLGLSVSRKVGTAVCRNCLRRLFREAFRLSRHDMPTGLDLILIPRGQGTPSLDDLRHSLPHLVRQLARRIFREAGRG
jgi:ribonuclease P protein component